MSVFIKYRLIVEGLRAEFAAQQNKFILVDDFESGTIIMNWTLFHECDCDDHVKFVNRTYRNSNSYTLPYMYIKLFDEL